MIEIKHRYSGKVIYKSETATTVKQAVAEAIRNGVNLSESDLSRSDLSMSDLTGIKDDFFAVLKFCPNEVDGLRLALVEGRVDGSTYIGECACLVGTIANVRHCNHTALAEIQPNPQRPAERWFLAIRRSDTPKNNPISKITVEWLDEWALANQLYPTTAR